MYMNIDIKYLKLNCDAFNLWMVII